MDGNGEAVLKGFYPFSFSFLLMNYLAILESECLSETEALLTGKRAEYARRVHDLKKGAQLKCLVTGCGRGEAFVRETLSDRILLGYRLFEEPINSFPINLVAAVPRPQILKDLVFYSACAGFESIHFVRCSNTIKSYLQTKELSPHRIALQTIKGLEQSGSSLPPKVSVHERFLPFVEDMLPTWLEAKPSCRIIAHGDAQHGLSPASISGNEAFWLALGPEGGWSGYEVKKFEQLGFVPVSLGKRIYRVEAALNILLGQIKLLREQYSI